MADKIPHDDVDVQASMMSGYLMPKPGRPGKPGSPVYNRAGELVGRVGEEPPEPKPLAGAALLLVGLNAAHEKTKLAIGTILDRMGELAAEAQKVRASVNLLDFSSNLAAKEKLAALKSNFDALKKEKDAHLLKLGDAPEFVDFRHAVASQLNPIQDIFDGEKK